MGSKFTLPLLAAAIAMSLAGGASASESNLGESSLRDLEQVKEAAGTGRVPTVDDLGRIQADTLVLQAQNALAEQSLRYETNTKASTARTTETPTRREMIPVVARVVGQASQPTAYLLLGDGSVVAAQKGVTVPGGFTVVEVSARQVRVRRGNETFALGFAATAPGAPRQAFNAQPQQP